MCVCCYSQYVSAATCPCPNFQRPHGKIGKKQVVHFVSSGWWSLHRGQQHASDLYQLLSIRECCHQSEHPKNNSFLSLQLATCPFPNFQCPQHGKRGNPVTFVFLVVRYAQGYDIYLWLPTTACWFSIGQKPKVYPNKKSLKTDC